MNQRAANNVYGTRHSRSSRVVDEASPLRKFTTTLAAMGLLIGGTVYVINPGDIKSAIKDTGKSIVSSFSGAADETTDTKEWYCVPPNKPDVVDAFGIDDKGEPWHYQFKRDPNSKMQYRTCEGYGPS